MKLSRNQKIFLSCVFLSIVILAASIAYFVMPAMEKFDMKSALLLKSTIEKKYGIKDVSIKENTFSLKTLDGNSSTSFNLIISGNWDTKPNILAMRKIRNDTMSIYPHMERFDRILLEVNNGLDVGFLHFKNSRSYTIPIKDAFNPLNTSTLDTRIMESYISKRVYAELESNGFNLGHNENLSTASRLHADKSIDALLETNKTPVITIENELSNAGIYNKRAFNLYGWRTFLDSNSTEESISKTIIDYLLDSKDVKTLLQNVGAEYTEYGVGVHCNEIVCYAVITFANTKRGD